jgi:prepilin-type N-terminal cleavage/methylation domain-containing protein/prepilin-type processing-associated H-X9-DG protein
MSRSCPARRQGFSLIELLAVVGIIATLIVLLLPSVQGVRESAARCQCRNNLKQIGLAIHHYHDQFGRLPAARGEPNIFADRKSWVHRILPYLEQQPLFDQANADFGTASVTAVPVLLCPTDPRDLTQPFVGTVGGASGQFGLISYAGVIGTEMFLRDPTDGIFDTSRVLGWRFSDIQDGTSNTLMVGERPPSADLEWGWWAYSDYDNLLATKCNYPIYPNCPSPNMYGPGDVNKNCDSEHFWSPHRDGGNWTFGDGSVRFIAYSGAAAIIPLSTRSGGEIVDPSSY